GRGVARAGVRRAEKGGGLVYHRCWPLAQGRRGGNGAFPGGISSCCPPGGGVLRDRAGFVGFLGAPGAPPQQSKSRWNFEGWAPTVRDGAEPAELPKEQVHVAGENAIISGMAGRYATALFELAREQNAIDRVKVDLDRFDALVAEVADLARLLRSPVFSAD